MIMTKKDLKIAVFYDSNVGKFEAAVQDWLSGHVEKLIDFKFSTTYDPIDDVILYSATIIYHGDV